MQALYLAAFIIYLLLGTLGLIGAVLSYEIIVAIITKRPILKSAFFLNKDNVLKKINLLYIVSLVILLTTLFTFLQKFFRYAVPLSFDEVFYYLAYSLGITTAVFITYVIYEWYKMIKMYSRT